MSRKEVPHHSCLLRNAECVECKRGVWDHGLSCNRLGAYTCMRCKICFCDEHVRRKGVVINKSQEIPCPKCTCPVKETKDYSVSVRRHDYGRQQRPDYETGDDDDAGYTGGYVYKRRYKALEHNSRRWTVADKRFRISGHAWGVRRCKQ
ncbi:hypothetical protein OSTOST_09987 [Ostertagia ostertagi]